VDATAAMTSMIPLQKHDDLVFNISTFFSQASALQPPQAAMKEETPVLPKDFIPLTTT
jgi:hypothetical protein